MSNEYIIAMKGLINDYGRTIETCTSIAGL